MRRQSPKPWATTVAVKPTRRQNMSVFRILETGNKKKGTHRGLDFHVSFLHLVDELENRYVGGEDAARVDGKTYDKAKRRLEALQRHWTYVGGYTLAQVDRDAGDSLS